MSSSVCCYMFADLRESQAFRTDDAWAPIMGSSANGSICQQIKNRLLIHSDDFAGKIRGLHGHRWLVVACDTKLLMHDLSSNISKEVARTAMDNKAPTSLAFLYINNPGLVGEFFTLVSIGFAGYLLSFSAVGS